MSVETEEQRVKRRHQRTLFDGVAPLYDATRRGYPAEIVEFMASTAGVGRGSAVLEIGCGTGQLTERLAAYDVALTAIDIGPSMVAAAQLRLGKTTAVRVEVVAFEDFDAPPGSLDLIASATAFHWIDPEVRFDKAHRLLRPDGWLALLSTGEHYEDPFAATLREMWIARSDDDGAWAWQRRVTDAEIIAESGLFEAPIHRRHGERIVLPVETVVGVENTRATSLSWPEEVRRRFTEEIREHLASQTEVSLTQETSLTMARVA